MLLSAAVPNVPCGVESIVPLVKPKREKVFLMYRVELKVLLSVFVNVMSSLFLMYRVELKVCWCVRKRGLTCLFLMYRVELKGVSPCFLSSSAFCFVPNVPCGVERI